MYLLVIFLFDFVGAHLEIVTDKSQEGAQFCKGFGGIGGRFRYLLKIECFSID